MVGYALRLVTRYDGMVMASLPDFPGICALGRDDEEARDEARKALIEALEAFERSGLPVPEPRAKSGSTLMVNLIVGPIPA